MCSSDLGTISYIKLEKIPEIDLYMDQVTSFMEEHLRKAKRNPEDKALTKTMINNYAKNNLLPPPVKKKYSKEHLILLLFIYYYKNLLSFHDIEQLDIGDGSQTIQNVVQSFLVCFHLLTSDPII